MGKIGMNKPIIIAICGKSSSGKDSLAKLLLQYFEEEDISAKILTSDTTRPKRICESLEYNFINENEFRDRVFKNEYLEFSSFNKWFYGTNKSEIEDNKINIGVFNPDGIISLSLLQCKYYVIPVYISSNSFIRLIRSIIRERAFKKEFIRRMIADNKDFDNGFYNIVNNNFEERLIVGGFNLKQSKVVFTMLKWAIFYRSKKDNYKKQNFK